ncbi:methyltransferase [Primorskyibacter flagellatus]|uniref:Methyltransferase n=1 Tax=Primorskyibacter flagellatus TaxID=1387277 RepID=A0A917EC68_9RHOB|nr:class I SAM-dependent methyltransferase [Primorskyibacter flagellatus]GGE22962.1 methyltransferase [Primorskyibacter flagellatus]
MKTKILYEAQGLPVFQNRMYATAEEALSAPTGDMQLVQDGTTGLVHNAAFDPSLVVYDVNYQNEQGHSPRFRAHLDTVAEIVARGLGQEGLVEVGCGKGFFLEMLEEAGIGITGFDPAYEGENPAIRKEFFDADAGLSARGLILRHVLEHIPDPVAFLMELARANGGTGRIYIEVPCFDWIIEHRAWFDIFYEHVNYFRLSDFDRIFGNVVESGRIFGGQYLYVVAELDSLRVPSGVDAEPADLPEDFLETLERGRSGDSATVVWGGASKGVIYSLLRARRGQPVRAVIDINPAKQGRHLAGTGLRVCSPQEVLPDLPAGSAIVVMNSNYLPEIRAVAGDSYTYLGMDRD